MFFPVIVFFFNIKMGSNNSKQFHLFQDKVEVRVARIFNTFGPRMHMNDGRVVSNFILQALQDEPITIFGKGEQTRSFQYVR